MAEKPFRARGNDCAAPPSRCRTVPPGDASRHGTESTHHCMDHQACPIQGRRKMSQLSVRSLTRSEGESHGTQEAPRTPDYHGKIKKAIPPRVAHGVVCTSVFMEGPMQSSLRISSSVPPCISQAIAPSQSPFLRLVFARARHLVIAAISERAGTCDGTKTLGRSLAE